MDDFINSRALGTSPNTVDFYETMLRGLVGYELTSEGINSYLASLTCGNGRRNYFVAIRAFVNWLVKRGILSTSPMNGVPKPKIQRKQLPSPTSDEIDIILGYCEATRDKAIVALAFSSALRLSELARVKWQDVDLARNQLKVITKGNKESSAIFDKRTKELLAQLPHDSDTVFGLRPRGIQDLMARLSKASGIRFSCHSLRRSFASDLRRKGLDVTHIMTLGNWSDLSMPLRYSQSVGFDDAKKLWQAVNGK